jgi:hypothetical protein
VLLDIFCDSLHAKLVGLSRSSCAEVWKWFQVQ